MTIHNRDPQNNPADARQKFTDKMRELGLRLSAGESPMADGDFHRCDVLAKGDHGEGDGTYIFHSGSHPFGWAKNWINGHVLKWRYDQGRQLTSTEQHELDEAIEKANSKREEIQAEARIKAKKLWRDAVKAADWHPYCEAKGVKPNGLKMMKFKDGNRPLFVPMYDEDGKLQNLQFIKEDGYKHYLKGGRSLEGHFWINRPDDDGVSILTICICEGWATGETVFKATGHAVIMTFGTGNLLPVAKWVRKKYPKARIVVCADHDWKTEGNPGLSKAKEAAAAVNGLLAVPVFDKKRRDAETDFNDMHAAFGLKEVQKAIDDNAKVIRIAVESESDTEDAEEEDDADQQHSATQADVLIKLASDAKLFHCDGKGYADFNIDGHRETWPIKSEKFSDLLLHRFYRQENSAPSNEAMRRAVATLGARAKFDGPKREIFLRVGGADGKIYVDLCDDEWRVVEIDIHSWRVIKDAPVRFRRSAGMLPLPVPVRGGSINDLRPFVNVKTDADFVLVLSFLLATLRDRGPYPGLALMGQEGSAKSTLQRALCRLVDPSKVRERRLSKEPRDLFISANNAYVLAFGNVSEIPDFVSDCLCSLMTGGGFATRALYTDLDEVLIDAQRPVIFNGIEYTTRPDLADRLIFQMLPPIEDKDRLTEDELWKSFDRKHPAILGALFSIVSHGLRALPDTPKDNHPRMADFARWATACEGGAGWKPGTFAAAYADNRTRANLDVIESDTVGNAIVRLMEGWEVWTGTATELLNQLESAVSDQEVKRPHWPKSAPALGRQLKRVTRRLAKLGIKIETKVKATQRTIIIKGKANAVIAVSPVTTVKQQRLRDDSSDDSTDDSKRSDAGRRTLKNRADDSNDSNDSKNRTSGGKPRFKYNEEAMKAGIEERSKRRK